MTYENRILKYAPQFLPILLIVFFVSDTSSFLRMSNTVLGRLVAIAAILLYTKLDVAYGIIVCLLVIVYYDSDMVTEGFTGGTPVVEAPPVEAPVKAEPPKVNLFDHFQSFLTAYTGTVEPSMYRNSADEFRQTHCVNGRLMKKGQIVKNDMAEHVFPIDNAAKCDVCSPTCDFTVLDQRLRLEENLLKPRDSNAADGWTWSKLFE